MPFEVALLLKLVSRTPILAVSPVVDFVVALAAEAVQVAVGLRVAPRELMELQQELL